MDKKDKKTGAASKKPAVKNKSAAKKTSAAVKKTAVKKTPAAAKKPVVKKTSKTDKIAIKEISESQELSAAEKISEIQENPESYVKSEEILKSGLIKKKEPKKTEKRPIDVTGILDSFRSKILITLAMFLVVIPVAFYYSDILLYYINKPFLESGNKLNIFTLMGGFMIRFKVSAAAAIFILIPVIIYQIWSVLVPSLNKSNRMFSRITIIVAVILFYSGVAFVFFLLLPAAIKVMLSFVGKDMLSTIGADNYLSFILFFSLSMGVLFEVPVIVLVLTRMGIVSPSMLSSKRKYAIVIIWIIAAVITPQPDPFSQAMVGVPLMIIYEVSIIISKIVAKSNLKRISYR